MIFGVYAWNIGDIGTRCTIVGLEIWFLGLGHASMKLVVIRFAVLSTLTGVLVIKMSSMASGFGAD
jgi:hypothetical protein